MDNATPRLGSKGFCLENKSRAHYRLDLNLRGKSESEWPLGSGHFIFEGIHFDKLWFSGHQSYRDWTVILVTIRKKSGLALLRTACL